MTGTGTPSTGIRGLKTSPSERTNTMPRPGRAGELHGRPRVPATAGEEVCAHRALPRQHAQLRVHARRPAGARRMARTSVRGALHGVGARHMRGVACAAHAGRRVRGACGASCARHVRGVEPSLWVAGQTVPRGRALGRSGLDRHHARPTVPPGGLRASPNPVWPPHARGRCPN
eukprot:6152834-Prymnesium_polylepis.2